MINRFPEYAHSKYKNIAFNNIDLLKEVIKFKKKFYRYSWDNLENALPGSIRLVPDDYRLVELKKDYNSMQIMISEKDRISFDDLLVKLIMIEDEINSI